MFTKFAFIISSLISLQYSVPGKYCGSVIGNQLNVSLSENKANISINLFGTEKNCNNEDYKLLNNQILLSNSTNDCLNQFLKSHYACPCPPHIIYSNDSLLIKDTLIGNITLNSC